MDSMRAPYCEARRSKPVALPRPHRIVMPGNLDPEPVPLAVARAVRRGIGEQILVPEILEDLFEDSLQLRRLFREERAAAADGGQGVASAAAVSSASSARPWPIM